MSYPLERHPRRGLPAALLWSGSLHVGADHRIELNLHLFFGLTLVAVACLLAQAVFPHLFPGWATLSYWLVGSAVAGVDGLAGLFHELGHAGVAMARGRRVSRITLYGLAAAVRCSSGPIRSTDQVLIAMAGPLSHLLMAGALWTAWNLLPGEYEPVRVAVGFSAVSNFLAGIFNLLPLASLDGGHAARALRTFLPREGRSVVPRPLLSSDRA